MIANSMAETPSRLLNKRRKLERIGGISGKSVHDTIELNVSIVTKMH
jgi:hypothetical protein